MFGWDCIVSSSGVRIERDSFVVSNPLVINPFPENSYIAGQPAKRIRERFFDDNQSQGE
jgi:acetyltransferase-like isoleucine patch superfamily enzyme